MKKQDLIQSAMLGKGLSLEKATEFVEILPWDKCGNMAQVPLTPKQREWAMNVAKKWAEIK